MGNVEYLVHHGCAGHLGRFRPADRREYDRGAAVVVRSQRGLELGEVLRRSVPDRTILPEPVRRRIAPGRVGRRPRRRRPPAGAGPTSF